MMQIRSPDLASLRRLLKPIRAAFWRTRSLALPDPLDDTGARIRGGRYNPRVIFGALYFSDSLEGSLLEVASRMEMLPADAVSYEIGISLSACLDLGDIEVRRAINPEGEPIGFDLLTNRLDFSIPLSIAGIALDTDAKAILAPSAAWHRLANAGIGLRYIADGVAVRPASVAEFWNLVVLRSIDFEYLRSAPVQISRLELVPYSTAGKLHVREGREEAPSGAVRSLRRPCGEE